MTRSNEPSVQHRFICDYLASLDCARSLAVKLLYESGEHGQLVALEFNPLDYNDLNSAKYALAATKLLSKATFLDLKIDRKAVAIEKFRSAEACCKETNRRVKASLFTTSETDSILYRMSQIIADILGDFDADEFVDSCNFGPGATTKLKRRQATHPNKFESETRISLDAYDFVHPWFSSAYPHWDIAWEIAGGSKIVTVRKNAKEDRTIAIEPGLNLWFQKGIGLMLRKRLLRAGIDLSKQSINQKRSRIASKYNNDATVDFSSASDTIAKVTVERLLPPRWFTLMDCFRSKFGSFEGEMFTFEKFSSMGNGFTFELETLIFYSLARACTELRGLSTKGISVYGDDVIIPVKSIDLFTKVASDLGFTVNTKKSYSSTYYRESCGSHWWNGVDIKPIFLKEPLNGKAQAIKTANSLRRYSHCSDSRCCDRRFYDCYRNLADTLKGVARISDGFGDIGLIENFDHPDVVATKASHGIEGFYVRAWVPTPRMVFYAHRGLWLSKLKATGDRQYEWWEHRFAVDLAGIGNDIPLPNRTRQAKVRLLIPQWADLGPWV